MVDVKELAQFIAKHSQIMKKEQNGIYNITDGVHPNLQDLSLFLIKKYNPHFIKTTLPFILLQLVAKVGDILPFFPLNSARLKKLSEPLTFSDHEARQKLDWNGTSVIKN
jgi:hypothetical protein